MQINMRIFTEEVTKAFQKLSVNVSGTSKQVINAVLSGCLLLVNAAGHKAPKRTRTLERSIHIGGHTQLSPHFDSSKGYSDIGGAVTTDNLVKREVGTNLIYAGVQEFGATIHAKNKPYLVFKTKDGTWHSVKSVVVPPHPYLRPAFDQEKDNVAREIDRVLDQLIRQAGF